MSPATINGANRSQLVVALARSSGEVRAAQHLRYRIFAQECGAQLPARASRIDEDIFDPYCDHLLVHDVAHDEVVGTCRILTSWNAKKAGQFYSETAFNLINLKPLIPHIIEVGRFCIHPGYRRGGVLMRLWTTLTQYMLSRGYEYLMSCATVSLADGGRLAAETYCRLRNTHRSPDYWRVIPHRRYPIEACHLAEQPRLPPLIKGYMRLGACICGEPGWNEPFNAADFLMLLPLSRMPSRYAHHFLGAPCHIHTPAASLS